MHMTWTRRLCALLLALLLALPLTSCAPAGTSVETISPEKGKLLLIRDFEG